MKTENLPLRLLLAIATLAFAASTHAWEMPKDMPKDDVIDVPAIGGGLPDGPEAGQPFVIGYGPRLLAFENLNADTPYWTTTLESLKNQGLEPLRPELRNKDFRFVFGGDE